MAFDSIVASDPAFQALEKKVDALLELAIRIQAHADTLLNAQSMVLAATNQGKESYLDITKKALQAVQNEEDQLRAELGLPLRKLAR